MYQIIINFPGGIISPGELHNILVAAARAKVLFVRFGLRQQLLIDTPSYTIVRFTAALDAIGIDYQVGVNHSPNIISSYPAEEIFIQKTWLTEGIYKDILDDINYKPSLKVNTCNSDQSFTPMLTGNINWIASSQFEHYWHLIIRFPKTNVTYEWNQLCYTNHIARATQALETLIKDHRAIFIDNRNARGEELFDLLDQENFILRPAEHRASLSTFNLPYYEGLNRYSNNKYWLGIYRRDELFSIPFLKKICQLCLDTKLGQLCCTSWKTIIVKGIEEQDKDLWNALLEEFEVNMRHAANELNFQVEDNCPDGLELKKLLVKHLSIDDTRTFGICFGIKTRRKSEIFSSILIQKRYLINFLGAKVLPVYDILCAKNFNPNERTGEIFSRSNPAFILPEQVRRAVFSFYKHRLTAINASPRDHIAPAEEKPLNAEFLYQCNSCFTVYNERIGDPEQDIPAHTEFKDVPDDYHCPLCEAEKESFLKISPSDLQFL